MDIVILVKEKIGSNIVYKEVQLWKYSDVKKNKERIKNNIYMY